MTVVVDLINIFTPGERRGRPYVPPAPPVRRAAVAVALPPPSSGRAPTDADAEELAQLAGRLRPVFAAVDHGDVDEAAKLVNALLAEADPRPLLARHDGQPWHLHFHGAHGSGGAAGWAAGCAVAIATVLGSEAADRLGVCSAPACDRVFVDASRNGSRRFCSTACQNRVKAAAHRARHR